MDMKLHSEEITHNVEEEKLPLLGNRPIRYTVEKNLIQKAVSQTFKSTAHLANLLPTGTVLAFRLLSPIFTNQGNWDQASRTMTATLIGLCGLTCFLLSFTDSFRAKDGSIRYGFATLNGLCLIDGSDGLPPVLATRFRLRFMDFTHAFMSLIVFAAVASFDGNVVRCFYPEPLTGTKEVLTALPVGIGVIASLLFVAFPTRRNGIGFPVSSN